MGRDSKLTPERQARIIEALDVGSFIQTACKYAGISQKSYENWINEGRAIFETIDEDMDRLNELSDRDLKYVRFFRLAHDTLSKFEIETLADIKENGKPGERFKVLSQRFKHWRPDNNTKVGITFDFGKVLDIAGDSQRLTSPGEIPAEYREVTDD